MPQTTAALETLPLHLADPRTNLLGDLLGLAERSVHQLRHSTPSGRGAAVARLRGSGPGISFKRAVDAWEAEHPVELRYPFEANPRVGGAVWPGTLIEPGSTSAMMKLRWETQASDLPMHTHEHSDRCIIVLEGRGFFHVTDGSVNEFTGRSVRTVAARERDVFVFTRGVVHTFSTTEHPMVLLSCHLPFIDPADPRQYTLPAVRWTAAEALRNAGDRHVSLSGWASLVTAE
jgi:quercetin dioxygenase-like cupin family protein